MVPRRVVRVLYRLHPEHRRDRRGNLLRAAVSRGALLSGPASIATRLARLALPLAGLVACGGATGRAPTAPPTLARLEESYQTLRYWNDQLGVTRARDASENLQHVSIPTMEQRRDSARAAFRLLSSAVRGSPGGEDSLALRIMRRASRPASDDDSDSASAPETEPCQYSADSLSQQPDGFDRLTDRVFTCYGKAAENIVVDGERLNRLAVLGLLGRTSDPVRRERLFKALEPVWRSVNGDDEPNSPYRILTRMFGETWRGKISPIDEKSAAFGASSAEMEGWLTQVLETWHAMNGDSLIEPWNFYYLVAAASRRLSPRIPELDDLRRVNELYYRSLGADPESLNVHYDLEAREGKYPTAYTDFGARPRETGGHWTSGEPWVFTSYLSGGLDNLAELLHESGHAVHIAAIRTRPAFMDWPDNDTFTEALADFPALELFEPAWQQRFLGDSAPLAESLRAKYGGIVFDVAWGLFEIRVHRDPSLDPNQVWTDITNRYLGIRRHPEWSWWAMRGQLIDGPGYLVNYAIGAIITADMRARMKELRGSFTTSDTTWYPWASAQIYRFGLERPSLRVLQDFLGRPLAPEALLADMKRSEE